MGLDLRTRAAIAKGAERGAVPVRYAVEGCGPRLEVIAGCRGSVHYAFTPRAGLETARAVAVAEMARTLPFARAWLQGATTASVERIRTGEYALPPGYIPIGEDFTGECSRVTHVLASFEVGGFVLTNLSAGSARPVLTNQDSAACYEAQRTMTSSPLCSGLLAAVLVPLSPGATQAPREADDQWRRMAVDYATAGRALLHESYAAAPDERGMLLIGAAGEYAKAAEAWTTYIDARSPPGDAYDARFLFAEAVHHQVLAEQQVGQFSEESWTRALHAAERVRDASAPRRHLADSARFAVELAEARIRRQEALFHESGGSAGAAPRKEPPLEGEGRQRRIASLPIPEPYLTLANALDAYVMRVPQELDEAGVLSAYLFRSAELRFLHGRLDEASYRYEGVYAQECARSRLALTAWERLITIANVEGDRTRALRLAEDESPPKCTVMPWEQWNPSLRIEHGPMASELQGARAAFQRARRLPDGRERDEAWHAAAEAYAQAMERRPERADAPEPCINGAYAYAQVLAYDRSIRLLNLMLATYSSEEALSRLQHGDPRSTPPTQADAEEYARRVVYSLTALQTLAEVHEKRADTSAALGAHLRIAEERRFPHSARKQAACAALRLVRALDTSSAVRARERAAKLTRQLGASCPRR